MVRTTRTPSTTSKAIPAGRPLHCNQLKGAAIRIEINTASRKGTSNGAASFIPATTMTKAASETSKPVAITLDSSVI